jgi:hypothetical protein
MLILEMLGVNEKKVVDDSVAVAIAILIEIILMAATIRLNGTVVLMVVVVTKELTTIPTSKISLKMKLVPLKIKEIPVLDVEVQTTGQRLVAHLHTYVNYTKHLLKEMRKK